MNISNVLNRFGSYALLPILLFTITLSAEAAIFMKLDGVDGESTDANHRNWIDVLSVSEGMTLPEGGATGETRRRGSVVFENISVAKELDKSSVKIREGIAQGKVYPSVDIEITATCAGARVVYFKYRLTNVLLTSISMSASGTESIPVEQVTMNFEEIKWTYTILDNECNPGGNVEASWKIEEGV